MFRLISKDYSTQKIFFLIYGICAGVASFMYSIPLKKDERLPNELFIQSPIMALVIFVTLYLLINYLFYADYKNDAVKLLATLPVNRKSMVVSKYIGAIILVISPFIIFFVTSGFVMFANLGMTTGLFNEKLKILLSYGSTFLILFSVNIPWYFKYEYTKAAYLNAYVSSPLLLFSSPFLLLGQMSDKYLPEFIKPLVADVPKLDINMVLLMTLASIILCALSIRLSVFLFGRKDLF